MAKEKGKERVGGDEKPDGSSERSDYDIVEAGNEGRALAQRILDEWQKEVSHSKKRKPS